MVNELNPNSKKGYTFGFIVARLTFVDPSQDIAEFFGISPEISPDRYFSIKYYIHTLQYTDISPTYHDIFFHALHMLLQAPQTFDHAGTF